MAEKFTYEQLMERGGKPVEAPQSVEEIHERNLRAMGIDTEGLAKRGAIAPVGFTPEGERVFAVPQFVLDMMKPAAMAEAVRGGQQIEPEDVTRAALDYLPAGRVVPVSGRVSARRYIEDAPTQEDIATRAGDIYTQLGEQGIAVSPEAQQKLVDDARRLTEGEYRSRRLFGDLQGLIDEWQDDIDQGRIWTLDEIENRRREAALLAGGETAQKRKAGQALKDVVTDYIDNLQESDLISGEGVEDAAGQLRTARTLWQRQAKVGELEDIFQRAELQASGFENGVRVQLRQLLNNPKRRRGWTDEELSRMRKVVQGSPVQNFLRWASKWGMPVRGSNRALGSGLGAGAGAAIGGPAGAAAVSTLGTGAGMAAARESNRDIDLLRAMIARGHQTPQIEGRTGSALTGIAGPVAGTQIEGPGQTLPQRAATQTVTTARPFMIAEEPARRAIGAAESIARRLLGR